MIHGRYNVILAQCISCLYYLLSLFSHINRRTSFEKPSRNPERAAPPPPTAVEAAAEAKRREAEAARRWPHAYQDDEDDEDPTSPVLNQSFIKLR